MLVKSAYCIQIRNYFRENFKINFGASENFISDLQNYILVKLNSTKPNFMAVKVHEHIDDFDVDLLIQMLEIRRKRTLRRVAIIFIRFH